MYFCPSNICDRQKPNPRNLSALREAAHGRSIPSVLGQGSFPWTVGHTALGSAHNRNQQELKNLSLGSAVLQRHEPRHRHQLLRPHQEGKEGTRPLSLFFGLLDFQAQTWRCAQCNFSIRKFINCAP